MINEIINTTAEARKDSTPFFIQARVAGLTGAVERMESEGQKQLVNSSVLPAEWDGGLAVLEPLGIIAGKPVEGDPLFVHVTLPDGWAKKATDHDMWSQLIDDEGRVRADIFYKAAFYDRAAFGRLRQRFYIEKSCVDWDKDLWVAKVMDSGVQVLWQSEPVAYGETHVAPNAWLAVRYPDWQDVNVYWDIEFPVSGGAG